MPFAVRFSDLAHSTELYIVGKWHPIIWAGWILCRFISDQFYSHVALDHEGGPSFLWSFTRSVWHIGEVHFSKVVNFPFP
jgi:hypothetical protein